MKARDWEKLADVYAEEVCDIFVRDRKNVIGQWLLENRMLSGQKSALDIGCGIGSFFRKYGRHFGKKVGTDHSARMLHFAQLRCQDQPEITWEKPTSWHCPQNSIAVQPSSCAPTSLLSYR